jgi:hypothetical protein
MLATWVSLCYSVQQTVCPTCSLRVLHRACAPLLIVFLHHENGLVSRGVRSSLGQWEGGQQDSRLASGRSEVPPPRAGQWRIDLGGALFGRPRARCESPSARRTDAKTQLVCEKHIML